MSKHRRRLRAILLQGGFCAATVFNTVSMHAATLGHSRVTSAPDAPLRIVVQVKDLKAEDLQSVAVRIAPAAAWQEAGLTPPVALDSLSTHLLPGHQDNVMQLVLQSHLVPTDKVLDVLVDLNTDTFTQRHQVSVLQARRVAPVQLPTTTAAPTAKPATHTVVAGQNLYGIARNWRDERYNTQQLMAALVEANPHAFIHGNMNLLRAGVSLTIPDADAVAALSPQQARQFYQTQLEQFDEYRQRIAKGEPPVSAPELVEKPAVSESKPIEAVADRLQLSAQTDTEAKKDQQTAMAQDLAHTAQRLSQLEAVVPVAPVAPLAPIAAVAPAPAPVSMPIAAPAPTPTPTPVQDTTSEPVESARWGAAMMLFSLGLFVLLVLLVAWFLRRGYSSRLQYAEIVPAGALRPRERKDTTEAEFREID